MQDGDQLMASITDVLQTLGVDSVEANRYAAKVVQPKNHVTFVEAYGAGNVLRLSHSRMRNLNVRGLEALDLRTLRADGQPWDFTCPAQRKKAFDYIKNTQAFIRHRFAPV